LKSLLEKYKVSKVEVKEAAIRKKISFGLIVKFAENNIPKTNQRVILVKGN
jgi:hypothetical protein